jgi:Ni/Fe-hydrogenase subunit HybB-like protein
MIAMGTLVFYAIQRASQAGWPILLYRVMEGITGYLLPGSILLFLFFLVSGLHMNHIYVWMDPETVAHDEIIQGKVSYLNIPFFMLRALIYLTGWNLYRYLSRRLSIAQDNAEKGNIKNYKLNFKISAGFLAFFFVTESMMAWDWIMSIDPHWFSTLFGWYVLASSLVTSVTVIAITTIFLKSKGYLPKVNDSHIHDLAKFMFGLSIFWTYLWFSQYMLIWYSNIPEEVTYFLTRIDDYQLPFFGMIILNFVLPLLILISSEYKRSNWIIVMAGIIIIIGHYIDIFNMIMPGTVGDQWFIGIPELGAFTLFSGLYLYFVFNSLSKVPLEASGDPYIVESKKFIY